MKFKRFWHKIYGPFILIALIVLLLPAYENPAYEESACCPVDSQADETHAVSGSSADKVELVYFHTARRCDACIYIEKRVGYIVEHYYKDEFANGKLAYSIIDLSDQNNAAINKKYNAVGSQLFINGINGGVDHIRPIMEIWAWDCLDNELLFDNVLIGIINEYIYGTKNNQSRG